MRHFFVEIGRGRVYNTVMSENATRLSPIVTAMTVLIGAAVPLRALGVASEQAALGLGLIAAMIALAKCQEAQLRLKDALKSPDGIRMALVFAAFAATIPFSFDPLGSLKMGGRAALLLLGATMVWSVLSAQERHHRLAQMTLIASGIAMAAFALLSFFISSRFAWLAIGDWRHALDPQSTYIDSATVFKAFAAAAMCLIPVVAWAGRRLGGHWRWWGYAYAPLAILVMVKTYNRSALAGVVAMTILGLALLAFAKRRHTFALVSTALVAAASIVYWIATREIEDNLAIPVHVASSISYLPEWLLDYHRQAIWRFAFERFLDSPIVGHGIDQLNRLPGAHVQVPGLDNSAYVVPSHPHNWILEILAETGLVGFLTTIFAVGWTALRLARNYIRNDDDADLALFVLMAGFWSSALFNFSIWASWWQLTFFVLFAIVSATRKSNAAA